MQPILLATDGSPSATGATAQAIELAAATGWPLHVIVVWRAPRGRRVGARAAQLEDAEREHAEFVLETVQLQAEAAGITPVLHLRNGEPAEEILAAAAVQAARVVVVGQHGWSRKTAPGGSVSDAIRHRADVPVLVVPHRVDAPAAVEPDDTPAAGAP